MKWEALPLIIVCLIGGCKTVENVEAESNLQGAIDPNDLSKGMPEHVTARRRLLSDTKIRPNAKCDATWQKALANGLEIVIANGYYDQGIDGSDLLDEISTRDGSTHNHYIKLLTAPCDSRFPNYQACGFSVLSSSAGGRDVRLTKSIANPRVSAGGPVRVTIRMTYASDKIFHLDNLNSDTTTPTASQKSATAIAERIFLDGFANADVVFYNGHARVKGGPDFSPVVNSQKGNSAIYDPNYGHYGKNRPGFKKSLAAIKGAGPNLILFGFFACATNSKIAGKDYFAPDFLKARPSLGYIGTNIAMANLYIETALMGALDAVIGQKCIENFREGMNVASGNLTFEISNFLGQ